jgi:hypothetical protein
MLIENYLENVFRIRNQVISGTITVCYDFIKDLSGRNKYCRSETATPDEMIACDSVALGSFLRGLHPLGIWPVQPKPTAIHMSVNQLIHELSAIRVMVHPGHDRTEGYFNTCSTEDTILAGIRLYATKICAVPFLPDEHPILLDEHRVHFLQYRGFSLGPWVERSDAIAQLGFKERDFENISSDSEADEDYESTEDDPSEPAEEFLDTDEDSYTSNEEDSFDSVDETGKLS